jgi:hypothetical protein
MGDRERISDRMRQDFSRVRRAAAALALLALFAAGCGRTSGTVPTDFAPSGAGGNNLLTVEMVNDTSSGQSSPFVRLRVYDRSEASGYGNYRRLPGQGFERVAHDPYRFDGTFNQRVETFETLDRDWQPNRQVDYLARAEFGGVETDASPTTNQATLPAAADVESLTAATMQLLCPPDTSKVDSLPVIVWKPVPGAVRYLIRIIRLDNHLFFYGFTPADGSHSYQLGSGLGDVLHENQLSLDSNFYWMVEAVDGNSRVIGRSPTLSFNVVTLAKAKVFCTP